MANAVAAKTLNIHEFAKQFRKEYKFLYEANKQNRFVAGQDEAMQAFDEMIKNEMFAEFVTEFCSYIGDFISSDREAAAFMFAFEALGGFENYKD